MDLDLEVGVFKFGVRCLVDWVKGLWLVWGYLVYLGLGPFYINGGITLGINNLCYIMSLGQSASVPVFRLITARTSSSGLS